MVAVGCCLRKKGGISGRGLFDNLGLRGGRRPSSSSLASEAAAALSLVGPAAWLLLEDSFWLSMMRITFS